MQVSADVAAGALQQRRLLNRHTLSLEPPSQSISDDAAEENSLFVDETEVAAVNVTDPTSQAAAPSQEAGARSLGAQIISAKACARDLQQSPCDSLLQQVSLDANNAYNCFVHLKDATSFQDLTKDTDAACFEHESFELTNGVIVLTVSNSLHMHRSTLNPA